VSDNADRRLLVTTHYWHPHTGGVETVAAAHARLLTARGWSVEAHSSRSDRSSPAVERNGTFELHRHRAFNPLEQLAHVPVPFPFPGIGRRLTDAARRCDLVVAHGHVFPITVAAAKAARRAGRPFVVMQHNPWVDYPAPIEAIERLADRTIGRRVLEQAEIVLCVSKFTEDYVRAIAPGAATVVVPNGVDASRFAPGSDRPTHGVVRFVCVRRLVPRNGVDLLLDAWRHAAVDGAAELVIAGDGPERGQLEKMARGLEGVVFAGRVTDERLVQLLQGADASIVPTRSGEGFGLVAAESHACGTPVIAADQGALPEVVRDGVDGILVAPGNVPALADAIRRVIVDGDLRQRLADGTLTTDWSWEAVGDRLDEVLRYTCRGVGTGPRSSPSSGETT
jgi:glycosyltransferase involved in cell wall biosynthesis